MSLPVSNLFYYSADETKKEPIQQLQPVKFISYHKTVGAHGCLKSSLLVSIEGTKVHPQKMPGHMYPKFPSRKFISAVGSTENETPLWNLHFTQIMLNTDQFHLSDVMP